LRDQVWKPSNIFTYKYWSPQHTQGRRDNLKKKKTRETQENPKPKPISFKTKAAAPLAWDFLSEDQPLSLISLSHLTRPHAP